MERKKVGDEVVWSKWMERKGEREEGNELPGRRVEGEERKMSEGSGKWGVSGQGRKGDLAHLKGCQVVSSE